MIFGEKLYMAAYLILKDYLKNFKVLGFLGLFE
jgi:hypothetical protein